MALGKVTIYKLKQTAGKPKMVVASVHDKAGGSLHAKSASELTYLELMNKVTGISPTFVGLVYVLNEKSYEAYYYFFSTIYKLESNLSTLMAIGRY